MIRLLLQEFLYLVVPSYMNIGPACDGTTPGRVLFGQLSFTDHGSNK